MSEFELPGWLKRAVRRAVRRSVRGEPPTLPPATQEQLDELEGPIVHLYDEKGEVAFPCPDCGGPVGEIGTCHTYGWREDGTGGKACIGCWTAICLYCVSDNGGDEHDGCGWEYIWGLNPANPRSKDNNRCRPDWIPLGARWNDGWPAT